MVEQEVNHLGILDGIRGLMAFWVFYGHLLLTVTGKMPRWGSAAYAVDVFMFLSGFLMMYHWRIRQRRSDSLKHQTFDFYIRRFFRIAPIYYLLWIIALLGQDYLVETREYLTSIVPPPWATKQAEFTSLTDSSITMSNVFLHVTFLFGFIPEYAANNVLPDWSIGLEMQFYLLLPLLVLALDRIGPFALVCLSLIAVHITGRLFGLYLDQGPLGNFPQPSLILFKLNIFIAGLCVAQAYLLRREALSSSSALWIWLLCGAISMIGTGRPVILCIGMMVVLMFLDAGRTKKTVLSRLLSGKIGRFLGDTSYCAYLLHMLLIIPIVYMLFQYSSFNQLADTPRFIVALIAVGIPVYSISYFLHRRIELPGIEAGRLATIKIRNGASLTKSRI